MTIGDRFRDLDGSLEDLVEAISDREFDVKYLPNFAYRVDLWESCRQAISDLADEPFLSRVSCAKVMGRAMELLREVHGVDAPRGWYPVMKVLRELSAPPPSSASSDDVPQAVEDFGPPKSPSKWFDEPGPAPEDGWTYQAADLFVDDNSSIRLYDKSYMEGALRAAAEERPAVMKALISVGEARGVPHGWGKSAFAYAEAVIAELQRQDEPLPEVLVKFRDAMREHEIRLAASTTKASGPTGSSGTRRRL